MFQPYHPPVLTARLTGFAAEPAGHPHHQEAPSTRRSHFSLGVMTNDAEKGAQAHLKAAGIYDLLDFVAGSDTGYGSKPAPEPLLAFAKKTDLKVDEIAMVGDSLHDLQAANAAGMIRVAVLTGMATEKQLKNFADIVLPSIADLPDLLQKKSV